MQRYTVRRDVFVEAFCMITSPLDLIQYVYFLSVWFVLSWCDFPNSEWSQYPRPLGRFVHLHVLEIVRCVCISSQKIIRLFQFCSLVTICRAMSRLCCLSPKVSKGAAGSSSPTSTNKDGEKRMDGSETVKWLFCMKHESTSRWYFLTCVRRGIFFSALTSYHLG